MSKCHIVRNHMLRLRSSCLRLMLALVLFNNIQLMHSFEVNIRICQPENSDVHLGEAEVNNTFEG